MLKPHYLILLLLLAFAFFSNCSRNDSPVLPDELSNVPYPEIDLSPSKIHHALLGYGTVRYDPATGEGSFSLDREASMHLNVEPYLMGFCQNPAGCIRIGNFRESLNGNLLVDATVEHPMSNDSYSVFDLRLIAMLDVDVQTFDGLGVDVSQAMINADGHTALWDNPSIPGDVNPFKAFNRFVSRRKFEAGTTSMETLEIKLPDGPLVFDIGVDASWAPKSGGDFPPEANSPEVIQINTYSSGSLTPTGGSLTVDATVIDHQGIDTIWSIVMDCEGIFNGPWPMAFESGGGTVGTYTATVTNQKESPVGIYDILIKVTDYDDVSNPLDLGAYRVMKAVVGAEGGGDTIQILDPVEDTRHYINAGGGKVPNVEIEITAVPIPPAAGVSIEWTFSDPDEPASKGAADESGDYETNTTPNDNNGYNDGFRDGGGVSDSITTQTDATGMSTVRFRTSTWGGDNYIIHARRITSDETADSPMITVWRKYLIRNDNMESSGGENGFYAPSTYLVNTDSYANCYMELEFYAGPVQDIPYQSTLYFSSGTAIINWCRTKTGFYSAIDTYQTVGVAALSGGAVGVAVPYSPHCIVASGELNTMYENEVTAHEVGHLFGMDHVDYHSLMYPAVDGKRQFIRSQITNLRNGPPLEPY